MSAAARAALGLAILTTAFIMPLKAQEAALPAMAFQTLEEAEAFGRRLALLSASGPIVNGPRPEILEYRVRSRGIEGVMVDSITLTNLHGREILRAGRSLIIAGKRQDEVSDLEPGSLLPIRHTRRISEPDDTIREDTALWDHAGLRFFCEGNRIRAGRVQRQLYRKEWRLGKDLPANAVDGLTAFIRFRAGVLAGSAEMSIPLVEGGGERSECVFEPRSRQADSRQPAAGHAPGIAVTQRIIPELNGRATAVEIELSRSNATPQRFEGEFFGMPATLELVRRRAP